MVRASPVNDFRYSCRLCRGFVQASELSRGGCRTCWNGDDQAEAAPIRSDAQKTFIFVIGYLQVADIRGFANEPVLWVEDALNNDMVGLKHHVIINMVACPSHLSKQ